MDEALPIDAAVTTRRFADRVIAPFLAARRPDGALERAREVLAEAAAAGLLARRGDREGAMSAVFGAELGASASVAVLHQLGRACAGFGSALLAQALADRLAFELGLEPGEPGLVAAPVAPRCPPPEVLDDPGALDGVWVPGVIGPAGVKASFPFVLGGRVEPSRPRRIFAFVRSIMKPASGWALIVLAETEPGVRLTVDERRRLGLRAMDIARIEIERPSMDLVADGDKARALLRGHLERLWLGLGAIAAGCAEGAIAAASRYAADRVQGGGPIARHAAVQAMLGEASARAASARVAIAAAAEQLSLESAARARLIAAADSALAVTASLQVLGGNGYMEDFPLEKRLRDVESLRVIHGTPDDLRRICAREIGRRAVR